MLAEKSNPMKIFFVSLGILFISIGTSAMLDWQVMSHSIYDVNDPAEYVQFNNYASWLAVNISMPGIAMSVLTCAFYWKFKRIRIILPLAILACTLILLISGLEDCIYFLFGQNAFPAANQNWNWLLQSRLFGFWNTTIHIIWTIIWVFAAIPVVSFMLYRKIKRLDLTQNETSNQKHNEKEDSSLDKKHCTEG